MSAMRPQELHQLCRRHRPPRKSSPTEDLLQLQKPVLAQVLPGTVQASLQPLFNGQTPTRSDARMHDPQIWDGVPHAVTRMRTS